VDVVTLNNESSLSELVNRILAGDSVAEEELVRRYARGVAIVIDQIVRSQSVTEDVAQDTFRIVLEKVRRGDLREPERLSGFVCSVARNTAIDYMRRTRSLKNREGIANAEQIPDPAPSQLEDVLRQEQAAIVRQVINELKIKRDRDLLFRYFIAEEDKDTICADLGITRAQFSNLIFRATGRFKELFARRIG
jgi:RNA polymerase sigma-70 factor, ECF subfamily